MDASNTPVKLRAWPDYGFQAKFLTESTAKTLMLKTQQKQLIVQFNAFCIQFFAENYDFSNNDPKRIIQRYSSHFPNRSISSLLAKRNVLYMKCKKHLKLTDLRFDSPRPIIVLIGIDVVEDAMKDES